jgi:hypothetical protein
MPRDIDPLRIASHSRRVRVELAPRMNADQRRGVYILAVVVVAVLFKWLA